MKSWLVDKMLDDVPALRNARNLDMVRTLQTLVLKKWREPDAAAWFESVYLPDEWVGFYVSASGKPGILPFYPARGITTQSYEEV